MLMMAAWTYREGVEKRSLSEALLGAAIFLPLGLWLFETVSLDLLVTGNRSRRLRDGAAQLPTSRVIAADVSRGVACFAAGAISGFLAGAVSIAGPPIAAFALKQGWSQARYKAFVTQCLLMISIYKAGLLFFRSHVDGTLGWQIVVAASMAIVGVQVGAMVSRGIPAKRFKHLVAIALLVVAVMMMWRGQSKPSHPSSDAKSVVTQCIGSLADHRDRFWQNDVGQNDRRRAFRQLTSTHRHSKSSFCPTSFCQQPARRTIHWANVLWISTYSLPWLSVGSTSNIRMYSRPVFLA